MKLNRTSSVPGLFCIMSWIGVSDCIRKLPLTNLVPQLHYIYFFVALFITFSNSELHYLYFLTWNWNLPKLSYGEFGDKYFNLPIKVFQLYTQYLVYTTCNTTTIVRSHLLRCLTVVKAHTNNGDTSNLKMCNNLNHPKSNRLAIFWVFALE